MAAVILAALALEVLLVSLPVRFFLTTAAWAAIAGASYLWVVRAMRSMDRLAKMAERERIARDLHDVLGHTLSLITLKSELAGQLLTQDADLARARQEIGDVEAVSRSALAEVRQTIRGYRAESLRAEIDRVADTLQTAGIAVECEQEAIPLDSPGVGALGLALREAATNIVRHAHARNCVLRESRQRPGVARSDRDSVDAQNAC